MRNAKFLAQCPARSRHPRSGSHYPLAKSRQENTLLWTLGAILYPEYNVKRMKCYGQVVPEAESEPVRTHGLHISYTDLEENPRHILTFSHSHPKTATCFLRLHQGTVGEVVERGGRNSGLGVRGRGTSPCCVPI